MQRNMSSSASLEQQGSVLRNGYFEINTTDGERLILHKLDQLIEESYENEVTVILCGLNCTPSIAAAFTRVFERYKGENQQWDELALSECLQNDSFHRALKEATHQTNLFRKIRINKLRLESHQTNANSPVADEQDAFGDRRDADVDAAGTNVSFSTEDDSSTDQQVNELSTITAKMLHNWMVSSSNNDRDISLVFEDQFLGESCMVELNKGFSSISNLRFLGLHGITFGTGAFERFVSGLPGFASLLTLDINCPNLQDSRLSELVLALPSRVQNLELAGMAWHDETLRAIATKLSLSTCQITDISLYDRSDGQMQQEDDDGGTIKKPTLAYLLQGMSFNRSLQHLDVESCNINDLDFQLIMTAISKHCPNIVSLDLSNNQISSLDLSMALTAFQQSQEQYNHQNGRMQKQQRRYHRLRSLDLSNNPVFRRSYISTSATAADNNNDEGNPVQNQQRFAIQLLQAYPTLGELDNIMNSNLRTPYIEHLLDWNGSGRLLLLEGGSDESDDNRKDGHTLERRSKTPMALWTTILSRVTQDTLRDEKMRQASVIFNLLHGPAFAGRHV